MHVVGRALRGRGEYSLKIRKLFYFVYQKYQKYYVKNKSKLISIEFLENKNLKFIIVPAFIYI